MPNANDTSSPETLITVTFTEEGAGKTRMHFLAKRLHVQGVARWAPGRLVQQLRQAGGTPRGGNRMKLYYDETINPRKACAVARHLQLPVEFVRVSLARGEQRAPAFARSGGGRERRPDVCRVGRGTEGTSDEAQVPARRCSDRGRLRRGGGASLRARRTDPPGDFPGHCRMARTPERTARLARSISE
jgi:hypothetical protein